MSDTPELTIDKLVKIYIKMRDAYEAKQAVYNKELESLKESMNAVKAAMLEHCKDNNVDSLRTEFGTARRSIKTKYWTADWHSFNEFVLEYRIPDVYEKKINQGVMKAFLSENPGVVPPGLNVSSEYTVTVTKPKCKK